MFDANPTFLAKLTIGDQVERFLNYYPGDDAQPLLQVLHGALGLDAAEQALSRLTDGFFQQRWTLGNHSGKTHTLTKVDSVAEVVVGRGLPRQLFELVEAGPPRLLAHKLGRRENSDDPHEAQTAWLERLCRARIPIEDQELTDTKEFTESSLFLLGTRESCERHAEVLQFALHYHPEHEDIEVLLRSGTVVAKARMREALMARHIQLSAGAAPAVPGVESKPARRARAV